MRGNNVCFLGEEKKSLNYPRYSFLSGALLAHLCSISVCQNNCSNHGHCDHKTKRCICEAFWMQNFFIYNMYGDSNCGKCSAVFIICIVALCVQYTWE